jgi:hypothetical protein
MTSVEFPVLVLYSQVTVFDPSLERPFNDWTDKHVAQGFSWRPRSAAFRTIAEDGRHLVTVLVDPAEDDESTGAPRIIDVPFDVPADGRVEIGSISDSSVLEIPPGSYAPRFECYEPVNGQPARVRFLFVRVPNPTFRIVRADPELSPGQELLISTSAA